MQITLDDPTEDVNKQIADTVKDLKVEEEKLPEDLKVKYGLSEDDQEKMRLAKSGDEVEVTINGKLTKIRKT